MLWYDVAISFAGEDRSVAEQLASELHTSYGLLVFYDDYEQAKLLGKNLTEYLIDIYKNRASYCIVLVSAAYREKRWTRHEWRAAQARAFEEPDSDYIIPIRLDDTDIPGLLPTVGYLDFRKLGPLKVARAVFEKVADTTKINEAIRLAQQLYRDNQLEEALGRVASPDFDAHVEALRIRADVYGKRGQYIEAIEALEAIAGQRPRDWCMEQHAPRASTCQF